ncbi:MAG: type II toxin-antitoxin system VapC family toxin [Rhodoferax sp.]|jgi:predicted nucleic acid-binding protein|nr:type II toxin-antitoxin system VapC family toxin [Rhodoferax sp.]
MATSQDVVIDASVSLAWLLAEPGNSASLRELFLAAFRHQRRVHVPALWYWECANVLLSMVKRKALQLPEVPGYLELMRYVNPQVDAVPDLHVQHATIELAQITGLSYYDASYVELALRLKSDLATYDEKMKTAAQSLGIECLDL